MAEAQKKPKPGPFNTDKPPIPWRGLCFQLGYQGILLLRVVSIKSIQHIFYHEVLHVQLYAHLCWPIKGLDIGGQETCVVFIRCAASLYTDRVRASLQFVYGQ